MNDIHGVSNGIVVIVVAVIVLVDGNYLNEFTWFIYINFVLPVGRLTSIDI